MAVESEGQFEQQQHNRFYTIEADFNDLQSVSNAVDTLMEKQRGGASDFPDHIDLVVCNADVPYATKTITNPNDEGKESLYQETYDWEDKFDFSSGVIAFHWSLSKSLEALNTHNVFMSANTTTDAEKS